MPGTRINDCECVASCVPNDVRILKLSFLCMFLK